MKLLPSYRNCSITSDYECRRSMANTWNMLLRNSPLAISYEASQSTSMYSVPPSEFSRCSMAHYFCVSPLPIFKPQCTKTTQHLKSRCQQMHACLHGDKIYLQSSFVKKKKLSSLVKNNHNG